MGIFDFQLNIFSPGSHSGIKQYLCADCGKQFKRKGIYHIKFYKPAQILNLFLSFSDKLREHILRMHVTKNPSSQANDKQLKALLPSTPKTQEESSNNMTISSYSESSESTNSKSIDVSHRVKFQPKVSPTEYQRFIYKCMTCMVGFKRRG